MTRRMNEFAASSILKRINGALTDLATWQAENPNVADYRVNTATDSLRRAQTLMGYLRDDVDPEGDAARAQLIASGFFAPEAGSEEEAEAERADQARRCAEGDEHYASFDEDGRHR